MPNRTEDTKRRVMDMRRATARETLKSDVSGLIDAYVADRTNVWEAATKWTITVTWEDDTQTVVYCPNLYELGQTIMDATLPEFGTKAIRSITIV